MGRRCLWVSLKEKVGTGHIMNSGFAGRMEMPVGSNNSMPQDTNEYRMQF